MSVQPDDFDPDGVDYAAGYEAGLAAAGPLGALVTKLVEEWWDCLTEEAQAQIADNASGYDAYEVANQACLDFAKLARAIGRDPSEGIEAEE